MSSRVALPEPRRLGALSLPRIGTQTALTVGLGALLAAIAFAADGGLRLGPTTLVEMALVLLGGAVVAGALLLTGRPQRAWGVGTLSLLVAVAALTALSVVWAVNPAEAWLEANRTLAYTAAFASTVALAHAIPHRWSAVLGAITLAAVVVSVYALLTKVFPGALNPDGIYARLRQPFGYWNAVGLMAALGVPGCLWLAARRSGHRALNALAYPALGLLLVTVLLSYSRGALLAAAIGAAFWFAVVPLRLRGLAVTVAGAGGAALVSAWVFGQDALTLDRVPLDLQAVAGHQFGLLLVVMSGLLLLCGLGVGFFTAQSPPGERARRRVGVGTIVALALVPVGIAIALTFTDRGLGGTISNTVTSLTDPDAAQPSNEPGRLTSVGSVRARYWDEALRIFSEHPVVGAGAGGYGNARPRFAQDGVNVLHAHGFLVQTMSDLGLVGLALIVALLVAWALAAARATGLRPRDRGRPYTAERIGLLTLVAVVIVFGVHSLVDWTWFVPATAVTALVAAAWVAGRGPLDAAPGRDADGQAPSRRERLRAAFTAHRARGLAAASVVVVALATAWAVWQPQRSSAIGQDALAALERGDADLARDKALAARDRNPLSVEPLFQLAVIESAAGRRVAARAALARAVRVQPSNPSTWLRLAEYELLVLDRPRVALRAIRPALYLDPRNDEAIGVFLSATRQSRAAS